MAGILNTGMNFGSSQPQPGQITNPAMLQQAMQYAKDAQGGFEGTKPAWSWAQLVGEALKRVAGAQTQNQLQNATAISPNQTGQPGASASPYDTSQVNPNQTSASGQSGMGFTTPTAQHDAATRNNNPGAISRGHFADSEGAVGGEDLADGKGNTIATFSDPITGAAAQFALLGNHIGHKIGDALRSWSTNDQYATEIPKKLGVDPNMPITYDFLSGPKGIELAARMAKREAGHPAPLTMDDWKAAQAKWAQSESNWKGAADNWKDTHDSMENAQMIEQSPFFKGKMNLGGPDQTAAIAPPAAPNASPQGQTQAPTQVAQNVPQGAGPPPGPYQRMPPNMGMNPQEWQSYLFTKATNPGAAEAIEQAQQRRFNPQATAVPGVGSFYSQGGRPAGFIGEPKPMPMGANGVSMTPYGTTTPRGGVTPPGDTGLGGGGMEGSMNKMMDIGQTAEIKKQQAQLVGKEYASLNTMGGSLGSAKQNLDQIRAAIQDPRFQSGGFGPQLQDIKSWLSMLPQYKDVAAPGEIFEKATAKNALDNIRTYFGQAGLGRVLQKEVDFVDKMNGSLKTSKQGLLALNTINHKYVDFATNLWKESSAYAKQHGGILDAGWLDHRAEWLNDPKNLPFSEDDMKNYMGTIMSDPKEKAQASKDLEFEGRKTGKSTIRFNHETNSIERVPE